MSSEFFQEAMPVGKVWKKSRQSGNSKYIFHLVCHTRVAKGQCATHVKIAEYKMFETFSFQLKCLILFKNTEMLMLYPPPPPKKKKKKTQKQAYSSSESEIKQ